MEFQHSYLKPEERRSRESFYPKLIWVVNGTRRQRDRPQLISAWNVGVPVGANSSVRRVSSDTCVLLREWGGSNVPTFFDLGELDVLWWLFSRSTNGTAYVGPFPRAVFIASHCSGATNEAARAFDDFVNTFPKQLAEYESLITRQPVQGLRQYSIPRIGRRRRL
jgi:competence protein CoiA